MHKIMGILRKFLHNESHKHKLKSILIYFIGILMIWRVKYWLIEPPVEPSPLVPFSVLATLRAHLGLSFGSFPFSSLSSIRLDGGHL